MIKEAQVYLCVTINQKTQILSSDDLTVSEITQCHDTIYFIAKGINTEEGLYRVSDEMQIERVLGGKERTKYANLTPLNHDSATSWLWWPENTSSKINLIVKIHGGPTAMVSPELDEKREFWLSKGYAYLEINYYGSSGFGRNYRGMLYDHWGSMDVDHCHQVISYVLEHYSVNKVFIKGGSAGGLTAFLLSAYHSDKVDAISCYYPVLSAQSLLDTHKFEAQYCERLLQKDLTMPLDLTDKLSKPMMICHGMEDKVVPIKDTIQFVKTLNEKNINVAFHAIPNEGHGFRLPENVINVLNLEHQFFQQHS